jgi:hypothetical protein
MKEPQVLGISKNLKELAISMKEPMVTKALENRLF